MVLTIIQSREVIDNTVKMGELNARLKQLEVALDAAQIDKQKAQTEATLAKEKIEALKLEAKQNELLVSFCSVTFQPFNLYINRSVSKIT